MTHYIGFPIDFHALRAYVLQNDLHTRRLSPNSLEHEVVVAIQVAMDNVKWKKIQQCPLPNVSVEWVWAAENEFIQIYSISGAFMPKTLEKRPGLRNALAFLKEHFKPFIVDTGSPVVLPTYRRPLPAAMYGTTLEENLHVCRTDESAYVIIRSRSLALRLTFLRLTKEHFDQILEQDALRRRDPPSMTIVRAPLAPEHHLRCGFLVNEAAMLEHIREHAMVEYTDDMDPVQRIMREDDVKRAFLLDLLDQFRELIPRTELVQVWVSNARFGRIWSFPVEWAGENIYLSEERVAIM